MPEQEKNPPHPDTGQDVHLPAPTIWPITVAFGITMFCFGVLTNIVFILFGLLVLIAGAYGWAGDLRNG